MLAFLHQFIFPMELFLAVLIYVLPLRIRKGGGWRCLLTGLVLLIVEAVWMQFSHNWLALFRSRDTEIWRH